MEIILLEDIGGLGKRGTAVRVADGYARNVFIPRKKAIEGVGNARAGFKDRERARVALEAKQRQAAEKLRDDLAQISLQFSVEAGEDDQLYGSVTAHEIQDALSAKGHTIERKNVRLPEPIKSLGVFEIAIHLYEDIEAPVKVWVVRKREALPIPCSSIARFTSVSRGFSSPSASGAAPEALRRQRRAPPPRRACRDRPDATPARPWRSSGVGGSRCGTSTRSWRPPRRRSGRNIRTRSSSSRSWSVSPSSGRSFSRPGGLAPKPIPTTARSLQARSGSCS